MNVSHWVMLFVIFIAGYVAARMFPGPGQAVGLP